MLKGFASSKEGLQSYIANLGHGMHPTHKPEMAGEFVRLVQEISAQMNAAAK